MDTRARAGSKEQALLRSAQLDTRHCRLVPLDESHHDALCEVVKIDQLWQSECTYVPAPGDMQRYIATAVKGRNTGLTIAYAIVLGDSGRVVGTTRYQFINWSNARLQIGGTWLGAPWRRSFVNTECKQALLECAFDAMGFQRVEFCVDVNNLASRRAIERIGAQQEGVLRNHLCLRGRKRDSVVYSCINDDWPALKARLAALVITHQNLPKD